MEYLYFAGDERFGALGVSVSKDQYLPRRLGPLPELADVAQIDELVKKVIAGEPIPAAQHRLIAPGVTMGGARPKVLLNIGGEQWVLKFSAPGEYVDTPLIEHAAMTLAARADICVAVTQPIALARGHAVAIKGFDHAYVSTDCRRRHAISANVALKAAGQGLEACELLMSRRWPTRLTGPSWPTSAVNGVVRAEVGQTVELTVQTAWQQHSPLPNSPWASGLRSSARRPVAALSPRPGTAAPCTETRTGAKNPSAAAPSPPRPGRWRARQTNACRPARPIAARLGPARLAAPTRRG